MAHYFKITHVQAHPATYNGKDGYMVSEGIDISTWEPKNNFEASYKEVPEEFVTAIGRALQELLLSLSHELKCNLDEKNKVVPSKEILKDFFDHPIKKIELAETFINSKNPKELLANIRIHLNHHENLLDNPYGLAAETEVKTIRLATIS